MSNIKSDKIYSKNVTWKEISEGGTICSPGNSTKFKTGDWRSMKPIFIKEKCKQCLLCFPVCPDSAIPVSTDGKRLDFDYDHCKGCGVCVKACPFDAIEFIEEGK